MSRWRVKLIRNLRDRLLQRGQTALQLGLPDLQGADLRLKITMAHAYPLLDSWSGPPVWESQEALQRFFQEQLGQALHQANITVQPTFVEIIRTMP